MRACPDLFIADGATDAEIAAARNALFGPIVDAADAAAEAARPRPTSIPPERQLRVRRAFRIGGRLFAEGQVVDRDDHDVRQVVKSSPEWLETPGRPLSAA